MSKEIVPFVDETQTPPCSAPTTQANHMSSSRFCRPQRSHLMEYVIAHDPQNCSASRGSNIEFNLNGENHHMNHFFPPHKGHNYVNLFYPDPFYVNNVLLKRLKGPSVLYLRGCDQLLFGGDFPFQKFKTLTALEISNVSNLTVVPKEISEMSQLQSLNLSHLPIQHFPANDFFSKLTNLRCLVLKACPNLHSLPKFLPLTALLSLDLSHLLIEALPDEFFSDIKQLGKLILRGSYKLHSLPSMEPLKLLTFLDLSYTTLHCKTHPVPGYPALTHVFCRDTKGSVYDSLVNQTNISVLDLSGAQYVRRNFQFHHSTRLLTAVDLSRTSIESIELPSSLPYLSILLLRNCSSLVQLPAVKSLQILKVLDMSGCRSLCVLPEDLCELVSLKELNLSGCHSLRELREGVFDKMSCLEKLDLSKTNFKHLPSSAAKLIDLGTHLILSPELSSNIQNKNLVMNLEIVEDDVASPCPGSGDEIGIGDCEGNIQVISSISKPNEFHLVSTFTDKDSPFKRYTDNFTKVKDLILDIHRDMEDTDIAPKSYCGRMLADLEYILYNIDLLETFDDKGNAGKLLGYLMDAVDHLKADNFSLDSKNLKDFLRLVAKLKILLPRPKEKGLDSNETRKKTGGRKIGRFKDTEQEQKFLNSYDSLTKTQKSCLLCFALLPSNRSFLTIAVRERTLIHLWYGEGFIDDARKEQNVFSSCTNSSTTTNPKLGRSTKTSQGTHDPDTIEEIGLHILMILEEKSFITRTTYFKASLISHAVHSLVMEKAKAERFLDFRESNDCKTPHLTDGSERACLLKSEYNSPSSCQIWLNYTKASHQNQECFKNVRTLFNVNEHFLDIRAEWFSKMTNLHVLHLGSWKSKNTNDRIEVVDLNFLEELKKMKQLRLISFEGVAGITKLPDSICMLTHLKMINLSECSQIEELPDGIGSLQNLSHLDVTHCPLLSMFPKGINLLPKLEVLKGFVITYDADVQQNKKACTLADLVKLEKLRKLNLVVNLAKFPCSEDLHVFKDMKNLCNLKITWLRSHYVDQKTQNVIRRKVSRHSRWQRLKCWEQRTPQNDEAEEPVMRSIRALEDLKKLVLCCFPSETAPDWLNPSELHNLEKLYIIGGHLKTLLPADTNQNTSWNVKALHLDHTLKLGIEWESLMNIFPNLKLLIKLPQDHLSTFPVDDDGLWEAGFEENEGDDEEEEEVDE